MKPRPGDPEPKWYHRMGLWRKANATGWESYFHEALQSKNPPSGCLIQLPWVALLNLDKRILAHLFYLL